jgi:hypothetical protein
MSRRSISGILIKIVSQAKFAPFDYPQNMILLKKIGANLA